MSESEKYLQAIDKYGNHFSPAEFRTREGVDMTDLDYDFFVQLLWFRQWAGFPMLITSTKRPTGDDVHTKGLAADLIIFEDWMEKVLPPKRQWLLATTWPFFGVGIYFDWHFTDDNGHSKPAIGLHVDKLLPSQGDRPRRWLRVEAEIDGQTEKLYYYQTTINGRFYNKKTQKTLELANVIKKVWQA